MFGMVDSMFDLDYEESRVAGGVFYTLAVHFC